jgi:spore coat protein U-like protein
MCLMTRILRTFSLIFLFTLLGILKAEVGLCQGCTMNATPINFGNYDVFSSPPLDAVGTITINCTWLVWNATVSLGVSSTSRTFNPRRMIRSGGTDLLDYNVYTDVARTAIFGDGTGGTSQVSVRSPSMFRPWSANISMYGRMPPGQNVSVGTYSDILTATVTP